MYTKEQMKSFGDWLASRKDVVTGSQIDEYLDGIMTEPSADVVEPQFGKVYFATVVSLEHFLDSGAFETRQRKLVTCLLGEWTDGRGRRVTVEGPFVGPVTEEAFTASQSIIEAEVGRRVRERVNGADDFVGRVWDHENRQ